MWPLEVSAVKVESVKEGLWSVRLKVNETASVKTTHEKQTNLYYKSRKCLRSVLDCETVREWVLKRESTIVGTREGRS